MPLKVGNRCVQDSFSEAKKLAALLGIRDRQLCIDSVAFGEAQAFTEKVRTFVAAGVPRS